MRYAALACFAALLACAGATSARADGIPGSFDFYVLSLSWSPTYCLIDGRPDSRQCGGGEPYGFIVHGLWPQYENGYPDYCEGSDYQRPPDDVVGSVLDIMPSRGLVHHQWNKHGTCAGLGHADYFDLLRDAYEAVEIPDDFDAGNRSLDPMTVERAFLAHNPDLTAAGIAVTCRNGALAEVRICMTRDLAFRDCEEVNRNACRSRRVSVPAVQ